MFKLLKNIDNENYKAKLGIFDIFKYIDSGSLVTVGFIDPGNWASNLAAGADYEYTI